MINRFTLIISAITESSYTINFRCWIIDGEGNQQTIAVLVQNNISLDDALIAQTNFITENK
jgi:hypothetical protein